MAYSAQHAWQDVNPQAKDSWYRFSSMLRLRSSACCSTSLSTSPGLRWAMSFMLWVTASKAAWTVSLRCCSATYIRCHALTTRGTATAITSAVWVGGENAGACCQQTSTSCTCCQATTRCGTALTSALLFRGEDAGACCQQASASYTRCPASTRCATALSSAVWFGSDIAGAACEQTYQQRCRCLSGRYLRTV